MPLERSVFVPRFDSQLRSSQSQKDEFVSCSSVFLCQTPAAKRRRPGLMLTVQLPAEGNRATGGKRKGPGPKCVLKPKVSQKKSRDSVREEPQSSAGSDSALKDAFTFTEEDKQPKSDKEKIKMAVLKNISRMLEENKHIRQRLESLSGHLQPHPN